MRIGIDIMGGDFAPEVTTLGAIAARKVLADDIELVLIGHRDSITAIFEREKEDISKFEIVHTTEAISMSEHPAKTFSAKPDSSIVVGFDMLKNKKIDAFASAGNTGAVLVGVMYVIKSIPGVIRPCITVGIPRMDGKLTILLDVGLNPDCRPDVLFQYGVLGSVYAENVFNMPNPRVGLLNIGEEAEKGNLLTKATHELMKDTKEFNFIGNVEGKDLYNGKADVIVCDGFTGNVLLKQAESFYNVVKELGIHNEYLEKFNSEGYGATPILGINNIVTVGHGASNAITIKNMILQTKELTEARISEKIIEAFL